MDDDDITPDIYDNCGGYLLSIGNGACNEINNNEECGTLAWYRAHDIPNDVGVKHSTCLVQIHALCVEPRSCWASLLRTGMIAVRLRQERSFDAQR